MRYAPSGAVRARADDDVEPAFVATTISAAATARPVESATRPRTTPLSPIRISKRSARGVVSSIPESDSRPGTTTDTVARPDGTAGHVKSPVVGSVATGSLVQPPVMAFVSHVAVTTADAGRPSASRTRPFT